MKKKKKKNKKNNKLIVILFLKDELEKRLQQRQAKPTGICPIRETLYDECFDELIRQITIDCKQRGLLLVRVRDEIRQQLKSYKTLYESSIAYGMRFKLKKILKIKKKLSLFFIWKIEK